MDLLSVLFNQQSRRIAAIVPSVVISERHSDAVEITEHPIGTGAPINDHAYKRPADLVMELGFAGGGSLLDIPGASQLNIGGRSLSVGTSPKEIYQQLLDLQSSFAPFDVTTGKRLYRDMLIRALEVTTDKFTENVLMITVTMREVILTDTQSVTTTPVKNMALGQNTAPVVDAGVKNPVEVNQNTSIMRNAYDQVRGKADAAKDELKLGR